MTTGSLAKMACAYGAHARARIVMPAQFLWSSEKQ